MIYLQFNNIKLFICFSFLKNYVHLIMLGLGAIIMWGTILDIILIKQLNYTSHFYVLHVFT